MKRMLAALLGASTVAVPWVNQAAAAPAAISRKVTGVAAPANQWGTVQLVVYAKITGTGKNKKVKYTDLGGQYSYHTSRSQYIMSEALPMLRQEFLQGQSANIQLISGATDTSYAFEQSLQSALLKLK